MKCLEAGCPCSTMLAHADLALCLHAAILARPCTANQVLPMLQPSAGSQELSMSLVDNDEDGASHCGGPHLSALNQRHLALPVHFLGRLLRPGCGTVDNCVDADQSSRDGGWVSQICLRHMHVYKFSPTLARHEMAFNLTTHVQRDCNQKNQKCLASLAKDCAGQVCDS